MGSTALAPLKGRRQLAAKIEAQEGVDPGSIGASDALQRVIDLNKTPTTQKTPRTLNRPSFTRVPDLTAGTILETTFGFELAGHSSGLGSEPEWSKYLRACGMRGVSIDTIAIGAITSGPFIHGERLTDDGTGSTWEATVVKDTYTGTTPLHFDTLHGAAPGTGVVITGADSGATATASGGSSVDAARGWWPATIPTIKVTFAAAAQTLAVGDEIVGGTSNARARVTEKKLAAEAFVIARLIEGNFSTAETVTGPGGFSQALAASNFQVQEDVPSLTLHIFLDGSLVKVNGCRGNAEFAFAHGARMPVQCTFAGIYDDEVDSGLLAVATYPSKIPPVFRGIGMTLEEIGSAEKLSTARLNALNINLTNNVVVREDSNTASGYAPAQILGRDVTMTFNPDKVSVNVFNFMDRYTKGEVARAEFRVGTVAANRFRFFTPGVQFDGLADGDRDEIFVVDSTSKLTGATYEGDTILGNDNELVLILD